MYITICPALCKNLYNAYNSNHMLIYIAIMNVKCAYTDLYS